MANVVHVADLVCVCRYDADCTPGVVGVWGREFTPPLAGKRVSPAGEDVATPVLGGNRRRRAGRLTEYAAARVAAHSSVGTPILVGGCGWGLIVVASSQEEGLPPGTDAQRADFAELIGPAEPVEATSYYVISEAVTNSDKHGRATAVRIWVDVTDGAVLLAIRDDGICGADPGRGWDLLGLRDRVETAGGTITIRSPLGEGTELLAELPLQAVPAPH
jgi:hypothetical protein